MPRTFRKRIAPRRPEKGHGRPNRITEPDERLHIKNPNQTKFKKKMNVNNDKIYHDDRGKFKANNPGRPVGTKNRNAIRDFVKSKVDDLPKWFDSLESDSARLDALIKLLPYAFPRLSAITDSGGDDIPNDHLPNLDLLSDGDLRDLARIQEKLGIFQP